MAKNRQDLQEKLLDIMSHNGIQGHVYFQQPASVILEYPAILYRRSAIQNDYADDKKYNGRIRYELTIVDYSPDSEIIKDILSLPYCSHDRSYASENLNHDVFTLYY